MRERGENERERSTAATEQNREQKNACEVKKQKRREQHELFCLGFIIYLETLNLQNPKGSSKFKNREEKIASESP